MLHGSSSAPALAASRDTQGYAHSERVVRKVPPLALVPLDQLQQLQQREEKETQGEEQRDKQVRRRRPRRAEDAVEGDGGGEREGREEQQQRLGERFLGMMALLARLRRMDLEEASSPTNKTERRQSARGSPLRSSRSGAAAPVVAPLKEEMQHPSAYELLVQKKKAERNRGVALSVETDGASAIQLSPHRKPEPVVNAATAPLREHLTFEISMLLPQPMDTRQSALESPIRRKKRRRRLRRKKRRLGATIVDGKRTWSTSHATWVPHASADYAKARGQEAVAAQASSKLVAKFAALKHVVRGSKGEELQQRMYLYANDNEERRQRNKAERGRSRGRGDDSERSGEREEEEVEEEEGEEGEGEEEEEDNGGISAEGDQSGDEGGQDEEGYNDVEDEEEEEEGDALPELLHPLSSAPPLPPSKHPPLRQPSTVSVIRPMQTHQAAWISPELRRWLIGSGLFRTTSTRTSSTKSTSLS